MNQELVAASVFLGTYLVLALGRLPGFRVDRTGAEVIGASLMIAFNILSLEEAYTAIDYNTIILLFGMMIVVANLRPSGFFAAASEWARAKRQAAITFWEYFKVGLPLTLITITIGVLLL